MSGLLLSGDVYVDVLGDGNVATGLIGPINTTKLSITANSETKQRASTKKASYGNALDSVIIPAASTVSWEFDDVESEMMAAVMLGVKDALNQGAGSLTDAAITLPANQRWVEIGFSNIVEVGFVAKLAGTDLVKGTDYEINYADGLIRAVKGGAVESGAEITVTSTYLAITGSRVRGGTKSQIKARLTLKGKNLANDKAVSLDIPIAVLVPDGEIDFMSTEFVTGSMSGDIVLAPGKDEPYAYDEID
jgi:hypothetical protein